MIEWVFYIAVKTFFVALAMIMNAAMDALDHNYSTSFAAKWKKEFWNPVLAWVYKYELDENGNPKKDENGNYIRRRVWWWFGGLFPLHGMFTSGWKLCKVLMIGFILIAVALRSPADNLWMEAIQFGVFGLFWVALFDLPYNKLRYWHK